MERVNIKDLKLGDIIWFKIPEEYSWAMSNKEERDQNVLHRIVGKTREGWITRGDNNNDTDAWVLNNKNIKYVVKKIW